MPRLSKAEATAQNWRSARIIGPWMVITGILFLRTNIPIDNVLGIVTGVLHVLFGTSFFVIALLAHRHTT